MLIKFVFVEIKCGTFSISGTFVTCFYIGCSLYASGTTSPSVADIQAMLHRCCKISWSASVPAYVRKCHFKCHLPLDSFPLFSALQGSSPGTKTWSFWVTKTFSPQEKSIRHGRRRNVYRFSSAIRIVSFTQQHATSHQRQTNVPTSCCWLKKNYCIYYSALYYRL